MATDDLLSNENVDKAVDPEDQPDGKWIDERGDKVKYPKSRTCAPADWETNQQYHPANVAIWKLWLIFYFILISVDTVDGTTIDPSLICGPWLPWHLAPNANYVILMLRYMPTRIANMISGRHPSAAMSTGGALISATWELLRLSLGGSYWSCAKVNFWFFAFPYRGKPTDVFPEESLDVLMDAWEDFVRELLAVPGIKIQLCSKGVFSDMKKWIFGGKQAFHDFWESHKDTFFSLSDTILLVTNHPECLLSSALKALWANGLAAMCRVHDEAYTSVLQYVSGRDDDVCQVGHAIDTAAEDDPAHRLRLEASKQALERAQKIVKEASIIHAGGHFDGTVTLAHLRCIKNWEDGIIKEASIIHAGGHFDGTVTDAHRRITKNWKDRSHRTNKRLGINDTQSSSDQSSSVSCTCPKCGHTSNTTNTIPTATVLKGMTELPFGTPRELYSSCRESYENGDLPLFSTKSNAGPWIKQIKRYLDDEHPGKSTPGLATITTAAKKESDGVLKVSSKKGGSGDIATYYLKVIDLPETLAVIDFCPKCTMNQNGHIQRVMQVTDLNEKYRTISKAAIRQ